MGDQTKPEKKKKVKYPRPSIKWAPNPQIIHEDQIVSSVAREKNIWGFMPTYEYEDINMNLLMSEEYRRVWFKQRAAFEKVTYAKQKTIDMSEANFTRKYIQKMLSYKRPTKTSLLESRSRDWKRLSEDEKMMIQLRETKYKVSKDCFDKQKRKKNQKPEEKKDSSATSTCEKIQKPEEKKDRSTTCTCTK